MTGHAQPGRGLREFRWLVHHRSEMCGRYSLIADLGELARRFEFDGDWLEFESSYNVAPTQDVLTVVGGENRRAGFMRWGLIPHWAKDMKIGSRMINARAETVAEKPAYRDSLKRRRCLVLADGFYEWQRDGEKKRPMRVVMRSGEPFAFAGIWSVWKDAEGKRVPSCSIITTSANETLESIHHRMPVVLPREREQFWLDPAIEDLDALTEVLVPCPNDAMEAYEVSILVNKVANNSPEVTNNVGGRE